MDRARVDIPVESDALLSRLLTMIRSRQSLQAMLDGVAVLTDTPWLFLLTDPEPALRVVSATEDDAEALQARLASQEMSWALRQGREVMGAPAARQATWWETMLGGVFPDLGRVHVGAVHEGRAMIVAIAVGAPIPPAVFDLVALAAESAWRDELSRTWRQLADEREQRFLEWRDDFLSTAAHELRTPLTAISGFVQLLTIQFEREQRESDSKTLGRIREHSDRLITLVNTLLDASRLNASSFGLVRQRDDLAQLTRDVGERLSILSPEHHLRVTTPADPVWVHMDQDYIEQVLTNLIQNAVKYTPSGGDIDIRVDRLADEERRPATHTALVMVTDQGIGIPVDDQASIFQRFYRASSARRGGFPGMGLGLYLSDQIVRQHGGRMAVRSAEGHGSTFSFTLPCLPPITTAS